ncbi:MAG: uridine kinase [Tissierellia bacterium]|jgi:uridine kinase|nr:uridine kinase [Bacillota bacterium]NLK58519.1 uridine kinase [Tissierellia bacterium]
MRAYTIGICGGSGSGKSTVTRRIVEAFGNDHIVVIEQDSYYRDQTHLPYEERIQTNYDHPDAFDTGLMVSQIRSLQQGKPIEKPLYDYTRHTRKTETVRVEPRPILILEGILLFFDRGLRDTMDLKVYVETDADVRILRRIRRDMKERGRTLDSVIDQYLETVRPSHLQFVEPSKRYADIIFPDGGYNEVGIDLLVARLQRELR